MFFFYHPLFTLCSKTECNQFGGPNQKNVHRL